MRRFVHTVLTACVLMFVMLAGTTTAETIYRSVDANGNVTYSNKPPENAVNVDKVSIQPGPSDAEQREAQERLQRQETTANEMSEERKRHLQEQKAATPAAPAPVEPEEPVNQYYDDQSPYYGYPNPNPSQRVERRVERREERRDQIRNRLQERPVQQPARTMPR